jgi:hypothetical protein
LACPISKDIAKANDDLKVQADPDGDATDL